MEYLVLGIFCASLLVCIILNISILYALVFGLLLFMLYGRQKGFSWRELTTMALSGVKTVRNILFIFLLIGIMTALWRASGTIPYIVCQASKLIRPSVFLLMTFLLNSVLSVLTGTSFGTAATMGVICASMGTAMNVNPLLTGGAILSGCYFGDRCSPVSTSALLVASITKTDIYSNIRNMIKSAFIPFVLSCLLYLVSGIFFPGTGDGMDLEKLYSGSFVLHWQTILPAIVILLLSVFRIDVKWAMGASIVSAILVCLLVQGLPVSDLFKACIFGYTPRDAEAAMTMSGGGIVSMLKVGCIVCISSAYTDLFNKTGLLDGARQAVAAFANRTTVFAGVAISAIVTGMIACNQTLTILLTNQITEGLYTDQDRHALDLEDTAVVIAPLIPWSIAGAVPLAAVNAPETAVMASFYLILLPLCRLPDAITRKHLLSINRAKKGKIR